MEKCGQVPYPQLDCRLEWVFSSGWLWRIYTASHRSHKLAFLCISFNSWIKNLLAKIKWCRCHVSLVQASPYHMNCAQWRIEVDGGRCIQYILWHRLHLRLQHIFRSRIFFKSGFLGQNIGRRVIFIFSKKYWKWLTIGREIAVFTFMPEVYPLIDSPMMLCNQPRFSRDYTDVKNWLLRSKRSEPKIKIQQWMNKQKLAESWSYGYGIKPTKDQLSREKRKMLL